MFGNTKSWKKNSHATSFQIKKMKNMKDFKKYVLPVTVTAITVGTSSCEKNEPTVTDKLVGQWEITNADGDLSNILEEYALNMEFHLSGDAEFCQINKNYKTCYIGDWEWKNKTNTSLGVVIDSDEDKEVAITLEIDSFKGDEINGEMTFKYDNEELKGDVTLERVYTDKSGQLNPQESNSAQNGKMSKGLKFLHKK